MAKIRVLTEEAEADRAAFEEKYGGGNCACHLTPPCGSCSHPGNPANQDEFEECWEEVEEMPPPIPSLT